MTRLAPVLQKGMVSQSAAETIRRSDALDLSYTVNVNILYSMRTVIATSHPDVKEHK